MCKLNYGDAVCLCLLYQHQQEPQVGANQSQLNKNRSCWLHFVLNPPQVCIWICICVLSNMLKLDRSLVWRWITQHPLQWVSTVLRARCQPKFTAPRVLWRSVLSPSWTKVCVCSCWRLEATFQPHMQSRNFDSILLLVLQINMPSGSSPERMVSIPLMSNSMALTFQEVLSKFGSGNQDRLGTLVWSRCTELDWREAQLVGYLSESLQFTVSWPKKIFLLKCDRYSVRVHY